jgi:hypothetical protein
MLLRPLTSVSHQYHFTGPDGPSDSESEHIESNSEDIVLYCTSTLPYASSSSEDGHFIEDTWKENVIEEEEWQAQNYNQAGWQPDRDDIPDDDASYRDDDAEGPIMFGEDVIYDPKKPDGDSRFGSCFSGHVNVYASDMYHESDGDHGENYAEDPVVDESEGDHGENDSKDHADDGRIMFEGYCIYDPNDDSEYRQLDDPHELSEELDEVMRLQDGDERVDPDAWAIVEDYKRVMDHMKQPTENLKRKRKIRLKRSKEAKEKRRKAAARPEAIDDNEHGSDADTEDIDSDPYHTSEDEKIHEDQQKIVKRQLKNGCYLQVSWHGYLYLSRTQFACLYLALTTFFVFVHTYFIND